MGEEADYLEGQSDGGAAEDMRRFEREQRMKDRRFRMSVKAEVARQMKRAGVTPQPPMGKMVDVVCACGCGQQFKARVADRKRGWGRFASKACAARFRDKQSGGRNREHYQT